MFAAGGIGSTPTTVIIMTVIIAVISVILTHRYFSRAQIVSVAGGIGVTPTGLLLDLALDDKVSLLILYIARGEEASERELEPPPLPVPPA